MPNRRPHDHIGNFNFKVEIDGITAAQFRSMETTTGGVAHKVQPTQAAALLLPAVQKASEITLKKGYTSTDVIWDWRSAVTRRLGKRKDVTIAAYDVSGREVMKLNLAGALPTGLTGSATASADGQRPIEQVSLKFEKVSLKW